MIGRKESQSNEQIIDSKINISLEYVNIKSCKLCMKYMIRKDKKRIYFNGGKVCETLFKERCFFVILFH